MFINRTNFFLGLFISMKVDSSSLGLYILMSLRILEFNIVETYINVPPDVDSVDIDYKFVGLCQK